MHCSMSRMSMSRIHACTKILDSLNEKSIIQSLQIFCSSKVDVCFSSDANLCVNKELIIVTVANGIRVVIKRIKAWYNNCVRCEILKKNCMCINSVPSN